MKFAFFTNKGPVREHNEDAIFAMDNVVSNCDMISPIAYDTKNAYVTKNDNGNYGFVVVDGMGGYEGGEKAAQIVASAFMEHIHIFPLLFHSEDWNISTSEAKNKITAILFNAAKKIISDAKDNPELSHMGAVCAGIVFCNENMLVFNCGDCRVYGQLDNHLEKLSHDHSLVQELFDRGEIGENDMRTHVRKNIVTACVSTNLNYLDIFFREISYEEKYKRIFICSDGVWEALSVAELEKCFCEDSSESADNMAEKLLALQERCHDNVSFIIIDTENTKHYSS